MRRQTKTRPYVSRKRRTTYVRGKLLERRAKLLQRLISGLSATAEATAQGPADTGDIAWATLDQDTSYHIGSMKSHALAEIDHALCRLEEGTYGICEECGRRIPAARLRAVPFASLCIACKQQDEREDRTQDEEPLRWARLGSISLGEDEGLNEVSLGRLRAKRPS